MGHGSRYLGLCRGTSCELARSAGPAGRRLSVTLHYGFGYLSEKHKRGTVPFSPTLLICNEAHLFIYVSKCLLASDLAIASDRKSVMGLIVSSEKGKKSWD
jgi:hypothetical protein